MDRRYQCNKAPITILVVPPLHCWLNIAESLRISKWWSSPGCWITVPRTDGDCWPQLLNRFFEEGVLLSSHSCDLQGKHKDILYFLCEKLRNEYALCCHLLIATLSIVWRPSMLLWNNSCKWFTFYAKICHQQLQ